jgi:hypothetical protein
MELAFATHLLRSLGQADQELDPGESSFILKVIIQLFFVKSFKFINFFVHNWTGILK